MRPRFLQRRPSADSYPGDFEDRKLEDTVEIVPLSPEAFIEANEAYLLASANAWKNSAEILNGFSNPEFVEDVRNILIKGAHLSEQEKRSVEHRSYSDSRRLSEDIAAYAFLIAREVSGHDTRSVTKAGMHIGRSFKGIPDLTAAVVISQKVAEISSLQVDLWRTFRYADETSAYVVQGLVDQMRLQPDFLPELATKCRKNGNVPTWQFQELQKIVAGDWWHPDDSKSQLRSYVRHLSQSDTPHIEPFINAVEAPNGNRRLETINSMARFAMIASGLGEQEGVAPTLRKTVPEWASFSEIEAAFQDFKKQQLEATGAAITNIAGSHLEAWRSVRSPRLASDVEAAKARFAGYFMGRQSKKAIRSNGGRRSGRNGGVSTLPTARELINEGAAIEKRTPSTEKELMIIKNGKKKTELVPIDIASIGEHFRFDTNDQRLADAITRMIEQIKANPYGPGTKVLRKKMELVSSSGDTLILRRFSPHATPGMGAGTRLADQLRIVYAPSQGHIVLVDILKHDEFDKKY